MPKELLQLKIEGHLKLYNPETGEVYYDDHNALTANAANLIRRTIVNNSVFLDQVIAMKGGVPLATASVSSIFFSAPPVDNEVTIRAVFDQASFNDTLDELQLGSSTNGLFSTVTGLSIFKDSNTQIAVEWTLKIIV